MSITNIEEAQELATMLATVVVSHMMDNVNDNKKVVDEPALAMQTEHSLNVLFSERANLVNKVVNNQTIPVPDQHQTCDEDKNYTHRDLPEDWNDLVKGISKDKRVHAYLDQLATQVHPRLLNHKDWKEFLTSEQAIKVWASEVTGMTGVKELKLEFDELNMPNEHRSQSRKVPLQLVEIVSKHVLEFIKQGLFKRAERPSFTSPTVIAPKSTEPFFRLAIDYRWINTFVRMIHAHVPVILEEINKAKGWRVFADIDWKAAFHQIPLHKDTSDKLTIITLVGPVSPLFMMEGVAPASSVLQNIVAELFSSLSDISICMFDNILTGAADDDELLTRVKKIVQVCVKHNIVLNFKKTFLGFTTAKFFGYELSEKGYKIDKTRVSALEAIPMPGYGKTKKDNTKLMQSFLGFSVYFIHFVERYAHYAAPLHDMTKDDFDWDKSTWSRDYEADFNTFKLKLINCMEIIYPDFSLEWILFVDASDVACGWVLLQLRPTPNGGFITEPLAVGSEKFSTTAAKWHINEKEAYALLRGLQSNHNLVSMKPLFVATDHFNLASDEHANNRKITGYKQQWAEYSFKGLLKVKGTDNVADHPSRIDHPTTDEPASTNVLNFMHANNASLFQPDRKDSAKTFTFYLDDKPYFTGTLTNSRCMSTRIDGTQCKNRTVIGADICWIHLLRKYNLAIRNSQYGKGLFAASATNERYGLTEILFKKDQKVLEYTGDEIDNAECTNRYGTGTAPYAMQKHKGLIIDAALYRGPASLANHSKRPNAKAGITNRNTITLTALKAIRNGDEITIDYNRGRGPKYNLDTRHTTNCLTSIQEPNLFPILKPQKVKPKEYTYTAAELTEAFNKCHTVKGVCYGQTQTYARMNQFFPGHNMSVKEITSRVIDCTACQKHRVLNRSLQIQPEVKIIEFPDPYTAISIDGMPISPPDRNGNCHIHIIKNWGTRCISLTAHKSKSDTEAAEAILLYRLRNGKVTALSSDKGSDYTSSIVKAFNDMVGIDHKIAPTSRPQATGCLLYTSPSPRD